MYHRVRVRFIIATSATVSAVTRRNPLCSCINRIAQLTTVPTYCSDLINDRRRRGRKPTVFTLDKTDTTLALIDRIVRNLLTEFDQTIRKILSSRDRMGSIRLYDYTISKNALWTRSIYHVTYRALFRGKKNK